MKVNYKNFYSHILKEGKQKTIKVRNFDPEIDDPNDKSYPRFKEVPAKKYAEMKKNIENAFKSLNIKKSELDGWSKEGSGYFIKGEFDKGVKIFAHGSNWYIATEDSDGYIDDKKQLPDDKKKIKELIDDYYFDVQHP